MIIYLSFSYSITTYFYRRPNLHRDNVSERKWDQRTVKWKVIGETSNLFISCLHFKQLSSTLLFLSCNCFCRVTLNWAQQDHGVGLIPLHLRAGETQLKERSRKFASLPFQSDSLQFVIHRPSSFLLIFQSHTKTEPLQGGGWGGPWPWLPGWALCRGRESSVQPPLQGHQGSWHCVAWKSSKSYFTEAS